MAGRVGRPCRLHLSAHSNAPLRDVFLDLRGRHSALPAACSPTQLLQQHQDDKGVAEGRSFCAAQRVEVAMPRKVFRAAHHACLNLCLLFEPVSNEKSATLVRAHTCCPALPEWRYALGSLARAASQVVRACIPLHGTRDTKGKSAETPPS